MAPIFQGIRPLTTDATNTQAWVMVYDPSTDTNVATLATAVNTSTGALTWTAHGMSVGDRVFLWTGQDIGLDATTANGQTSHTIPTLLYQGVLYYVVEANVNDFKVSTELGGTAIVPTDAGAGSAVFVKVTELVPSQHIQRSAQHEWGYDGSWPDGLAYDMLAYAIGGGTPTDPDYSLALINYQTFAERVYQFPHHDFRMEVNQVEGWLEQNITITSDFVADRTAGTTSTLITFTNLAQGFGLSYVWDFGDGSSATTANPTHTYTAVGSYTVTLTTSNQNAQNSSSTTKETYITIS